MTISYEKNEDPGSNITVENCRTVWWNLQVSLRSSFEGKKGDSPVVACVPGQWVRPRVDLHGRQGRRRGERRGVGRGEAGRRGRRRRRWWRRKLRLRKFCQVPGMRPNERNSAPVDVRERETQVSLRSVQIVTHNKIILKNQNFVEPHLSTWTVEKVQLVTSYKRTIVCDNYRNEQMNWTLWCNVNHT